MTSARVKLFPPKQQKTGGWLTNFLSHIKACGKKSNKKVKVFLGVLSLFFALR